MHLLRKESNNEELLRKIVEEEQIYTLYQPIASLIDGSILGYEALSRGPKGTALENPGALFEEAVKNNMLWELEYLCRKKAIYGARDIIKNKNLFINVDPKVIYDDRFKSGMTKDFISVYDINPSNIIFEITEWSFIEDYRNFKSVINNYINQGYRIAIDDTGAGYSGLRMLAEMHPNYIKIDMELIRDIDKKVINQALIKTLNDFAAATNMHIIAEGIETIDEITTLIDLGIKYGQGYLLQRPNHEFLEINTHIKELILDRQRQKLKQSTYTTNSMPIGEIARFDKSVTPMTTGSTVNEIFSKNPSIYGIPVEDNGIPVGLIMRNNFYANLATQYGVAVFMNRPIKLLMNKNPLIVDYNTSLAQVSKIAIGRREEDLYDYIIITKNDRYYGVTTVKSLLEHTTQLELNKAKHSNPLTGLPGNINLETKC
ncbi:MAG: EAL domain-containing protein [Bacillota bacterium]